MTEPGASQGGGVSTAFLSRLAERTRIRRWNRTRTVVLLVVVVALVVVAAWVVLGSSLLSTRTVDVRGVDGTLAAQVRARADDAIGTPLARVSLGGVASSVESIRGVGSAHVTRRWPHTLRVVVVPRTPVAVTRSESGYLVLDETGAVLSTKSTPPAGLPNVVVGDGVGARLVDGLTVLGSVPPAVARRVELVDIRSGEDIRLTLRGGDVVRWGSAQDGARKAVVLAALLNQKASVYDVSAPDLPTTRR